MNPDDYTPIPDIKGFLSFMEKNRLFYIEDVRKWFNDYGHEKISLSKLTELLNEKFFNWYQAQSAPSNTVEEDELKELRAWKESAMRVMPDFQAIGKELGLKLGDTVHDKILPAIINYKKQLGITD